MLGNMNALIGNRTVVCQAWIRVGFRAHAHGLLLALLAESACSGTAVGEIQDKEIVEAVETMLSVDDAVSSHLIDVSVANGIVSLSGSVDNLLASDRAARIAESIRGVRSVINRISVSGPSLSDAEVKTRVAEALMSDPATDACKPAVEVSGGSVILSGTVESWAESTLSEAVVKGVSGVKSVKNQIRFKPRPDRTDSELLAVVKGRLKQNIWVDDARMEVSAHSGAIKLSGTVGSAAERRWARDEALFSGAKSIDDSELRVEWGVRDKMRRASKFASKTDDEVRQAVSDALHLDPRVLSFQIDLDVKMGRVTLSGTVDNLKAKRSAERDTENTPGVWQVNNRIKVRPGSRVPDEALERSVRKALERDAVLNRSTITIKAVNGKVYLTGTVDNEFERSRAEDVVSAVNGVVVIRNNLHAGTKWAWRPDGEIKQDVAYHLWWNSFVDYDDVEIEVENGVVTLTGTVATWIESLAAEKCAREGGAKEVKNLLTIKFAPDYPDFYRRPPSRPYDGYFEPPRRYGA
jgi:osmotically-inducible protein OsmY